MDVESGPVPDVGGSAVTSDLLATAEAFADLGARLAACNSPDPLTAITLVAHDQLAGVTGASITTVRHAHFTTAAATDERTRLADGIQYELESGPCLDAIVGETMYRPRDLSTDSRWPTFGRRVSQELGFWSMLAYRLLLPAENAVAGLNLYADEVDAFSDQDAMVGLLLATHGAQAAAVVTLGERVANLNRALETNRRIGVAVGVLMSIHKVTDEQAFDLLRVASQNSNRRLASVAEDVIETGTLDFHPHRPLSVDSTASRRRTPLPGSRTSTIRSGP
jgi:hypothetical protein